MKTRALRTQPQRTGVNVEARRRRSFRKGMILFLFLSLLSPVSLSFAESPLSLSEGAYYDIYIGGDDGGSSLIKSVMIAGMREVNGIVFLVVYTDSFSQKKSEGLVSLRYIRAIVPVMRGMTIQGGKSVR